MRNLWPLTTIVTIMVVIEALAAPLVLLWLLLLPESFALHIAPVAEQIDAVTLGFTLLTFVVFGIWIYVAGRNLRAAGFEDLAFSPASRIWWFAVPFANLVMPYHGMRELWNASHGNSDYTENQGLVGTWWALWLGGNLAITLSGFMAGQGGGIAPLWIAAAIGLAQAAVAILLIRGIAAAQANLDADSLEEVFA